MLKVHRSLKVVALSVTAFSLWFLTQTVQGAPCDVVDPCGVAPPAAPCQIIPIGLEILPCVTQGDLFIFVDAQNKLKLAPTLTPPRDVIDVMVDAANQVRATHGDLFDFVSFFLTFDIVMQGFEGTNAFYFPIKNDVSGIGSQVALPAAIYAQLNLNPPPNFQIFDLRQAPTNLPLNAPKVQGILNFMNIDNRDCTLPGTSSNSMRLLLGQEFAHRFGAFLDPVNVGGNQLTLQGAGANCNRSQHWNSAIDAQGSSLEMPDWLGSNPATAANNCITDCFNSDIGGVYSFLDLYLMGYAAPCELDQCMAQFRFMRTYPTTSCPLSYAGPIDTLTAQHIITANGCRTPNWINAQKDFRTAWVIIHKSGTPPTIDQKEKAVCILRAHQVDWFESTLRRGTMDNTLPSVGTEFRRGDFVVDGFINQTDAIVLADSIFNGNPPLSTFPCHDAGDADESGSLGINDVVGILHFAFVGDFTPFPPGPFVCGLDPTSDNLTCQSYTKCCQP